MLTITGKHFPTYSQLIQFIFVTQYSRLLSSFAGTLTHYPLSTYIPAPQYSMHWPATLLTSPTSHVEHQTPPVMPILH